MAEFKPMVKMYTDEPSVILKLKKGGKVKAHADGFKSMHSTSGGNPFDEAESGKAPKKPAMAQRMKAMNPNQYAKGGKVAHKQMGGAMPMAAPGALPAAMPAAMPAGMGAPMGRRAVAAMAPAARAARAAMVRRALTGMKKGGSTSSECAKLERELKHHEAMSAARAHGKASGGEIDAAETKTTLKNSVAPYAKTKMDTSHKDTAHGTGEVKEGKPGGYKRGGKAKMAAGGCYAMGGSIMGNEGPYENTKMNTAGKGKTNGTTGGVRMGNAGGFKHGGKAKKYSSGGEIDDGRANDNEKSEKRSDSIFRFEKTNPKTSGIRSARAQTRLGTPLQEFYRDVAGGESSPGMMGYNPFASGGAAKHHSKKVYKASGGAIDSKMTGTTVEGGNWENRPANTSKPGKSNTKTGEVKLGNAGGYRHGGHASKKAYATGGNVVDDGKAEKMPRHFVSQPVANNLQSGTFKRGGKVKMADGGTPPPGVQDTIQTARNERAYRNWERSQREEAESDRSFVPDMIRRATDAVRGIFSGPKPPAGSVTKTEKSVTVAPGKKRGGKC